jgi:hypothetical protein
VAKRTRGARPNRSRSAASRPPVAQTSDPRPVDPLTVSQLDAATQIAEDVVASRPAAAAREVRNVARSTPARQRAAPSGLLAARAAQEYVYVAQDVRRIVAVVLALLGVMIVLWLLIVVARVVPI